MPTRAPEAKPAATAMTEAFARVGGLTPAAAAFAAACDDAARLAVNRGGDPVAHWLRIVAGPDFRPALSAFIAAVASSPRATAKSGGVGQAKNAAAGQARSAPPPETHAGEANRRVPQGLDHDAEPAAETGDAAIAVVPQGQSCAQGQCCAAASPDPNAAPGAIHEVPQGHLSTAPVAAPSTVRGIVAAKELSARVMSGVKLTERQGSRIDLDVVRIGGLDRWLKFLGGRAAKSAVEYNTVYLVKTQIARQAYTPPDATVGDVLDATEIRHLHSLARAFASSPMVQLPEALRPEAA